MFLDYFSDTPTEYLRYRPCYPQALFEYLAALTTDHQLAVDIATGNGQAASGLAPFYQRIVALDASPAQLMKAKPRPHVEYFVSLAEETPLLAQSVDLVTVAQAMRWFDWNRFYPEVNRILKPDGVLAVWGYNIHFLVNPELDAYLQHIYYQSLFALEPPEVQNYLDSRYASLPFPLPELAAPEFFAEKECNFYELIGYIKTWTCSQRYINAYQEEGLLHLLQGLPDLWQMPLDMKRLIRWPLFFRVGRNLRLELVQK